jgi:hypothetical protein
MLQRVAGDARPTDANPESRIQKWRAYPIISRTMVWAATTRISITAG